MSVLPAFRIVRFVLAPVLSFWVAGAGCMLGCEGMVAAASTEQSDTSQHAQHTSTIVASGNACSSAKSHSCCSEKSSESTASESKAQQDESKVSNHHPVASRRSSSDPMNCPFAVSRAVVVGKAQGGEKKAVAVLTHSMLVTQGFAEQLVPLSRSLRLPNRGHTYLRCCVFLI